MAYIIPGRIRWRLRRGDAINESVLVEDYDLAGKQVAMDVREDPDAAAVLRFSSEDGSIVIAPHGDDWMLTFVKTSLEMKVPEGNYRFDIEAYTTDYDTQTFGEGEMTIAPEFTRRKDI